jgi:hypothetical protein
MNRADRHKAYVRDRHHSYPGGLTPQQWRFLRQLRFMGSLTIDGHQFGIASLLKKRGLVTVERRQTRRSYLAKVTITQSGFVLAQEEIQT